MGIADRDTYVALAGGANLDIIGRPSAALIPGDSNPGRVRFAFGGVCRNIAENLARLEVPVELITALGSDAAGRMIGEHCVAAGIGMEHTIPADGEASSVYMAITDEEGDMAWALSDMSTMDSITPGALAARSSVLSPAALIVADANLPSPALEFLAESFPETPLFIDPVSTVKSRKLIPLLGKIHTLKMNCLEAEAITGLPADTREHLTRIGGELVSRGIRRIFITSGSSLVYWNTGGREGFFSPPVVSATDTTGAGDAFMAGIVYSTIRGFGMDETLRVSAAMARLTVICRSAVNPDMRQDLIDRQ